jgi:hypothetical protein
MDEHQHAVAAAATGRRPRWLLRGPALWLAGATAVTVAATAAVAGPLGPSRLTGSSGTGSPGVVMVASTDPGTAAPDFGRRRGNPGAARTPVAKVTLTEADAGKTITVKPGTEIDVALKPDSGSRWAPPRSSNPNTVSRGGRMGWHWRMGHGQGRQQDTPDFGKGRRGQRDGSTHAVFFAHRDGDANLTSAERKGGFFLPGRSSTPSKSWSVKVTVSGPAPAAPKPKPGAPAPGTPAAPGAPAVAPVDAHRLVTPVTAAVQRLGVTLPRL